MPPDDYDRTKNGYVSNAPLSTLEDMAAALRRACATEELAVIAFNRANATLVDARERRKKIEHEFIVAAKTEP